MSWLRTTGLRAALMLCLWAGSAWAQQSTPSEEAALQAYREGSFSRAVQLYTRALSETEDPSHRAQLHVSIAWTLFALGREDEVHTHLRAALLEDPELSLVPDYYTKEFIDLFEASKRVVYTTQPREEGVPPPDLDATLASIEQRVASSTDLEGALADVDRLLESYPRDGRLIPLRVELLRMLGRDDEATQMIDSYGGSLASLPVDQVSIPDLILRANRLLDQGDDETAFSLLREAVSRQPSNVAALELMAEAAVRTARWQDAEFALKSALGFQPDNLNLQLRLGGVYLAKNDPSAARDVFRQLTERYPHSDRAWAALGLLDATLGNDERSLRELANALNENPLLPEVQLAYGELLLERGDYMAALEALQAAGNLLHDDSQVWARLGQVRLALGRDADALENLRTAIAGGYRPFDVQRSHALALAMNGLLAESDRTLSEVPPDPAGDSEIIRALLASFRGDYAGSEQILGRVAEIRPGDAAVLNLMVVSLYHQERYADAVTIAERAASLRPENPVIRTNLERARAARAAELLAEAAATVRAAPD
jgi:tetratricopeptide (TPR) repeat protein